LRNSADFAIVSTRIDTATNSKPSSDAGAVLEHRWTAVFRNESRLSRMAPARRLPIMSCIETRVGYLIGTMADRR
jgi:hypothetical protein